MQPPYPAPVTEWHNDTYDAINPKRAELSQTGKTVIITGAGQGIGREVVDAFSQAGAGAIHILGRTMRTLQETKNITEKNHPTVTVTIHVADIVDASAVEKAAKEIGSWDVLIPNAGYIPRPSLIKDSEADEWWKTFEAWDSPLLRRTQILNANSNRSTSKAAMCSVARFFLTKKLAV
jgi:NADP-dependent 3-hydroxy acid dehydrogenase YdfG